jgi:hypothetical protein
MRIPLGGAWIVLVAVTAGVAVACGSSSGGGSGSSRIYCILEGDACLCSFDAPAPGTTTVADCSSASLAGTICCADNGWPSNASGAALCECATYNSGCTAQVASCSAGTSPAGDGG